MGSKCGKGFLFLLPFVIYLSWLDLPNLPNLKKSLWWTAWRFWALELLERTLFSGIICLSPKLSKVLATTKHYKKLFLIRQFLREVLCLNFDRLSSKFYDPGQNIWHKIEKSSKTGGDKKSLISTFACFFIVIAKLWFLEGRLGAAQCLHPSCCFFLCGHRGPPAAKMPWKKLYLKTF